MPATEFFVTQEHDHSNVTLHKCFITDVSGHLVGGGGGWNPFHTGHITVRVEAVGAHCQNVCRFRNVPEC